MIDEAYVPESEEELELMEDLFVATRRAHRRGLPKIAIARLLAYQASATLDPKSLDPQEESLQSLREPESPSNGFFEGDGESYLEDEETDEKPVVCPVDGCKYKVSNVLHQLGGELKVKPCGHTVDWDNRDILGDWVEDPGEEE